MDLRQVIDSVRSRITKSAGRRALNEQDTKATLIEPMLRALGWTTEDVEEVAREFKVKSRDEPVDYALLLNRTPRLFVEAKALGQNLDDRKWARQMMGYAAVAGVEWIVLTDGDEYRIFAALAAVPVDEKLVRSVKISAGDDGPDGAPADVLGLLARDRMQENRLELLWKALHVDRKVKAALTEILDPAADSGVLKLLRKKLGEFSTTELRASLGRAHVAVSFPAAPIEFAAAEMAGRSGKPVLRLARGTGDLREAADRRVADKTRGPRVDCSLKELIDAGAIAAPIEIFNDFKGVRVTARLERDGSIVVNGRRVTSLSAAGGIVREALPGARRKAAEIATPGWAFWKYRAAGGVVRSFNDLRAEFMARRDGDDEGRKDTGR